jgi:outer membrane receptor protein involved in Fe transport
MRHAPAAVLGLVCLVAVPVAAQEARRAGPETETETESQSETETEPESDAEAESGSVSVSVSEPDALHCDGTGVEGVVRDAATGETLIEAPVLVVGRGTRVLTDYDGRFAVELPPGTYSLRSYYDLYQPTRLNDVVVQRGRCTRVELELDSNASEGEEVVIEVRADTGSEASALRARRESAAVQDGVSAEEIRRSPDSDAGQAARRIVGATVVGGQYLFVRGLGGRYSSVLLDGAYLPSSDPDQPGVQLDLFPSAILNGLTVSKTFTPDLPGDAAGGTMLISTGEYPSRLQLAVTGSLGFNSQTTFQSGPTGPAGGLDWLGFDDGRRGLPASVPRDRSLAALPSLDEQLAAGRGFRPRFGIRDSLAAPAGRLGVNMGDTAMLGDRRLGWFVSLGYANTSQILRNELVRPSATISFDEDGSSSVQVQSEQRRTSFTNSVNWGGLASANLELSEQDELRLTVLALQGSESYTGVGAGYEFETDQDVRATRLRWVERNLFFGQLGGEHRGLPFGARLRWAVAGSFGGRSEPDIRDMIYGANVGSDTFTFRPTTSGSGERFFLDLRQRELDANADLAVPIATATLRLGGAMRLNERDFDFRRFRYEGIAGDADTLPATELFDPARNGLSYTLVERTERTDGYRASQALSAGFAMLDWQIVPWLRAVGGARVEAFRQTVASGSTVFPAEENTSRFDTFRTDLDVLGSAGLIFRVSDEVFVRASYGTTVARPQVRELARFPFPDFIRQRTITGRAGLVRTRIHNFDLRAEWFPSPTEVVAVTGFAKSFEQPIEITAEANNQFSYRNFESGLNAGAEVETRLSFGRIAPELRFFDLGANVAVVYSEIQMTPEQRAAATSSVRPLAGQSPYVINLSLGFSHPDSGLTLRAYYNVFGPRLLEVGIQGVPDVYQEPFYSFDVTAAWQFHPGLELRAGVENVFDDDFLITQGGLALQQYNQGISASLGLTWRPL